ncbi:hypothetical protein [Fundicoccus culcitae]|uniref:DUF4013 domain-containing protein n=1 Tax=Fundicoccus culcitae TaxID=2969821 RepID=A0ABY5P9J8_9LACT|nr:hypothetical protein [Fundicoccus culcitae]UUX35275.1 hypothetical protein NRE15_06425 [Fundicoccus culcitae]
MRKYLELILNQIMDIIALSLILICGLITIVFFPYSAILAIEYDIEGEFKLIDKKKILVSLVIGVFLILVLSIILLNLYLLPTYPDLIKGITIGLLLIIAIVVVGLSNSILYLTATSDNFEFKEIIKKGLVLFYTSPLKWAGYFVFFLLTLFITYLAPASIIISLGINIKLIVIICNNAKIKLIHN